VWEVRFDCRRLKELLNDSNFVGDLNDVMYEIIEFAAVDDPRGRLHFFEVELRQVTRVANDALLNERAIRNYISQVAPVPFRKGFSFAGRITKHLTKYGVGKTYNIYFNENSARVERPFTNSFAVNETRRDRFSDFESFEIAGLNGEVDAVGWLLHHSCYGALPNSLMIKGLRLRLGNIQIGADNIFEALFPEPRFNSWSVGEIHVVSRHIVPNGRRDDLEQNVHQQNLLNHVTQYAKRIAKRCRAKSAERHKAQNRPIASSKSGIRRDVAMKWANSIPLTQYVPRASKAHRDAYCRVLFVLAQLYGVRAAARIAKLLLPRVEKVPNK
jgi:molecular chaperone HtpG